ncbi:MAG TPA: hypothetical protein PKA37_08120 [Planctomycetota bacterium]|jgi:hypothetical protein|nr:hypothetical protein [Planctomycetota bacterium]
MNLGSIVLSLLPVLLAGALALLVYSSTKRQRIAVLLGFLVPGLGHFWLGYRSRALFFASILWGLFLVGLIMGKFAIVSPFERHPIWGIAQIPGGLMAVFGWLVSGRAEVTNLYNIACLYAGSACLLNIVALCDAWDLGDPKTSPMSDPTPETPGHGTV